VDRFLEHSRIFYFENACQPEVYVSSADWMPRNFYRRIEIAFPIEDGQTRTRIIDEILGVTLVDNRKARFLSADGQYSRPKLEDGEPARRSQFEFIAACDESAQKIKPASAKTQFPEVKLAPRPVSVSP